MANEFSAGAGGLLGTNDLQQSIDTFKSAVDDLKSTVSNMATSMGSGMLRHPAMGMMAEGQTFTRGSLNDMAMGGNGSFLTSSQQRGAVILGQGQGGGQASSTQPPTMGQTASGGGANGGGTSFGGPRGGGSSGAAGSTAAPSSSGSSSPPPTMGSTAAGGGANGGGATFGGGPGGGGPGGPGGPSGPIGGPGGPGMGATPASFLGRAAGAAVGGIAAYGMGQYGTQLLFNAYGQQQAASWGYSAQSAQNNAFGNGNGRVNAAAAGNAQSAASEFTTLNQMAGGGAVGYGNALQAANAFAFTNQGLGAAGGAQLASSVYNPVNSLRMQMLTGVSSINPQSGQLNSMSSIIGGLASDNYLGGGGYNSKTGTFRQSALNASFTPGRGTSYMNLQSLGYNQTQISDIQSMTSQANQAANKGHTSISNVLSTMNSAEYGSEGQIQSSDAQLKKWGVNLSTIQKQGNLSSLGMSQSQSQSSTYNEAISGATTAMTKFTQAVNYFLDKTGLNKALGLGGGVSAGMASTGLGGIMSGIAGTAMSIASMGGGAAGVSTAQPMTSQGSKPGSSTSNVSGSAATAVKDAEGQVGKPYVYGGSNPQTSFDCSGLVMWAYGQAGVKLPRTSQQQWAALKNKSVPANQAREGDIVFQGGSDGTAQAPGHEALMISSKQIVEAPYTGANIRIRAYNPNEWQHVGRPVGKGGGSGSTAVSGTQTGSTGSSLGAGNSGAGNYGSTEEVDAVSSALGGGMGGGTRLMSTTTNGSSTSGSKGNLNVGTAGGGTSAANKALAQKMASQMYGWSGSEWSQGLDPLWTQESGFRSNAQNPTSTAYGIAQFLDTTWGKYGPKTPNAGLQIKYGLEYVHDRYGNPLAAEAHEKQYNWYGTGTRNAAPGMALVGDRGPELISLTGGQQIHNAQDTSNILQGKSALPAQSPWMASAAQQLLLDTLSPANSANGSSGSSRGGVNITLTVEKGAITVTGSTGTGSGGSSSDVQSMADAFGQAIETRLQKSELLRNIAKGNTG